MGEIGEDFIAGKEEALRVGRTAQGMPVVDRKLAQKRVWIRQGIRTALPVMEGRIHALEGDASRAW